ncbi:MAG TPA: hypothetical protein V6D05_13870 [Stenomitos sp.]
MPTPNSLASSRSRRPLGAWLLAVALLAGCSRAPDTTLTFEAQNEGRRLMVEGTTSLPDEAPLLVQLHKPPDMTPLMDATAIVKGGKFAAVLELPVTMAEGPYALRVFFSPRARAWSPQVQEVVGPHGERMRGPLVRQDAAGDKVLERIEPIWIGPTGV